MTTTRTTRCTARCACGGEGCWRGLMRHIRLLAGGLVIIVMAQTLSAQRTGGPPTAATGVVGGRVAAADTSQPLRRAQIRLVGTASTTARTTTTDGDGRFMFENVAAGDYTVSATKPAYFDMVFGARKSGLTAAGTPLRVADRTEDRESRTAATPRRCHQRSHHRRGTAIRRSTPRCASCAMSSTMANGMPRRPGSRRSPTTVGPIALPVSRRASTSSVRYRARGLRKSARAMRCSAID